MVAHTPRLAGIVFTPERRKLALADALPRMDVAAFVGFAATGPLHTPTALEDVAQFAAIFGPDLPLAWDEARGETVFALLGPAVRAFFRNGGRRCWALRVPTPTDWRLDAALFLDRDLAEVGELALLARADFLRYQAHEPRELDGIHALLAVEEATLVAVPDAAQRGWVPGEPDRSPVLIPPVAPAPPPPCAPPVAPPEPGQFAPCEVLAAPSLLPIVAPMPGEPLVVAWTSVAPEALYELEEASTASFADAVRAYLGPLNTARFPLWSEGTPLFRVRALLGDMHSAWSEPQGVRLASTPASRLRPPTRAGDAQATVLEALHRALLRMCAARGDQLALLSLPDSYREQDALQHAQRLDAHIGEPRTRSFGALYHPWLLSRDEASGATRRDPPDGAVAGMMARHALARGAWVAPANQPLDAALALSPTLGAEPAWRLRLQEAGVNLLVQAPRGFMPMSAYTLAASYDLEREDGPDLRADDLELRPINVRRLLILLRRLALRLGPLYVFEPNSAAFRRSVQRGFEALLEQLFLRGAFAGANAASAFQVDVGPALNPPQAADRGQLIVELRVAPSRPLSFLTVRVVRDGDQGFALEER